MLTSILFILVVAQIHLYEVWNISVDYRKHFCSGYHNNNPYIYGAV